MAQVAAKVITWDEYVRGEPADLEHYEIEDGVVIELPAPSVGHQRIVINLVRKLSFLEDLGIGVVLTAPCDIVVQRKPVRTRQPDVFIIRKERFGETTELSALERIEIAPDLVIEVISPRDSFRVLMRKLSDYHRIGVREVWLVNPLAKTVEVFEWNEDDWNSVGVFSEGDELKSKSLPEISLPVRQIFETGS